MAELEGLIGLVLYERWPPWLWSCGGGGGGAGDELQRVPRAAEGVQRGVRAAAVLAVDRGRRGAGPRHRLRRQVLRPRRAHVLPHRRPRAAAPSGVPVTAVRGGGADDQPGERRRGAARRRELAPLPGGRGDRPPRRRHPPAPGARRRPPCGLRPRPARSHGEGERGGARRGVRLPGALLRPGAVPQPRVSAGARGAAARHAVDDLGGVRDDDQRRRRREEARAAEPFCLRVS